MHWPTLTHQQIRSVVLDALGKNVNYYNQPVLGVPGTRLDPEVFDEKAPFLYDAPFLSTMVANPNHIGCHTLGESEHFFYGTQQLEKSLIAICAEEIFNGQKNGFDGYVASGGSEANIEALWIYRNYFMQEKKAAVSEVGVLFSADSHYSIAKGINLLGLQPIPVNVDQTTRQILEDDFCKKAESSSKSGIRHFILILNMGTTMFGSIDDNVNIVTILKQNTNSFKVHVDAAYGGFMFPFTAENNPLDFRNPDISSITVDAHKLLQTPYGTGIFITRKGLMQYVQTKEASYVEGTDYTLCGSRSGANAIAIWMVLHTYGSEGWKNRMLQRIELTDSICNLLAENKISFYRHPLMNIITLPATEIPAGAASAFHLVADNSNQPAWYKIVVMPHITLEQVKRFIELLKQEKQIQ